jgi:2,4-dienoyl-CoA reductase (NADPH2)
MPLGKKVAIVGGDFVACELADFLASKGRNVVIVGSGPQVATEMPMPSRWRLLNSLLDSRVIVLTEVKCQEITRVGVLITKKDGRRQTIEADTVVFAEDIEPNPGLFQAIEGKMSPVYLAGDYREIGLIKGAIADGARTALSI